MDEAREILRAYRENQSRVSYLESLADEMKRGIWAETRPEMQAIHAQGYEYHSGGRSSPTERHALRGADGAQTDAAERWAEELKRVEDELFTARMNVSRVEIWLAGLTEKERIVITAHEIDHLPWYRVAFQSEKLLGHYMSESGLRHIGRGAINKINHITRGV